MENHNTPGAPLPPVTKQTPPVPSAMQQATMKTDSAATVTDPLYRREFEKIVASGGKYKGKWNWYAFFFSWIWLITKGAWAYAALIVASLVLTFSTGMYPYIALGWTILCGLRGTWIYYNVKVEKKQMLKSLF
jgi:hypothetical protein